MFNEVKKIINEKLYIIPLIIILICAYGFSFTHLSIGIDDFSIDYYLTINPKNYGNLVQQGRLIHFVFYYLIGISDVIPFMTTFISVIVLFISCLFLCGLVQKYSNNYFDKFELLIFSAIYSTFPIIVFKFIYEIDVFVFMLSFLCVPISIYFGEYFFEQSKRKYFYYSVLFLIISISSYESFLIVYMCEVICLNILNIILDKEKSNNEIIKKLFLFSIIFIVGTILYFSLVKGVQYITNNSQYSRTNLLSKGISLNTLKTILRSIRDKLLNFRFLFNTEVVISTIFMFIISIYYSFKKRNILLLFLFFSLLFLNYFMILIQTMYYFRTNQPFIIFVAFSFLFLKILFRKKFINILLIIVIILQIRELNIWFYQDYITFDKNKYAVNEIMRDIETKYDTKKYPVCFVNRNYESPLLMNWDSDQGEIGESALISSSLFLGDKTSKATHKFFEYCGYRNLIVPNVEQGVYAYDNSEGMPFYPNEGYIKLKNGIIIVNLGKKK